MKSLISFTIVMLMYACTPNNHQSPSDIEWDCPIFRQLSTLLDKPDDEKNRHWENVLAMDTLMIDYLIAEMDSNSVKKKICICEDSLTINYTWKSEMTPSLTSNQMRINRELYFLYLINAIYYKDLYFCSGLFLYREEEYEAYNIANNRPLFLFYQDYQKNKSYAISTIKKWRSEVIGNTMQQIRDKNLRPLGQSGLFWIGEKGGKIDIDYTSVPTENNRKKKETNEWE